jgi:plasmid maintenance system antidote protein VapI
MKKPKTKHRLFDTIIAEFQLKNDTQLARFLGVTPTPINDARNGGYVSAGMILRIYDKTGWSIEKIRGYLEWSE